VALADPLASDIEDLADIFQCPHFSIVQTKAQTQDVFLAVCQRIQDLIQLLTKDDTSCIVDWVFDHFVFDKVPKMAVIFLTDRRLQRNRLLSNLKNLTNLVRCHIHTLSDLLWCWVLT